MFPRPNYPTGAKPLSRDMLLGKMLKEPIIKHKPYLESLTHLKFDNKKITTLLTTIPLPDVYSTVKNDSETCDPYPVLGVNCPNLTRIFLQENCIYRIGSGAFNNLNNLV